MVANKLWERQQNESSKAYSVFCVYRDLGPERSQEKTIEKLPKKRVIKTVANWASKFNWVARCQAYDDYLERKKREEREKAILDMVERHTKEATALQQKGLEMLRTLIVEDGKWQDAWRLIIEGAKLERLSRGEPTEIGKQEISLPAIVEVMVDEKSSDTTASRTEQNVE